MTVKGEAELSLQGLKKVLETKEITWADQER
jgi:hypothetical protein